EHLERLRFQIHGNAAHTQLAAGFVEFARAKTPDPAENIPVFGAIRLRNHDFHFFRFLKSNFMARQSRLCQALSTGNESQNIFTRNGESDAEALLSDRNLNRYSSVRSCKRASRSGSDPGGNRRWL